MSFLDVDFGLAWRQKGRSKSCLPYGAAAATAYLQNEKDVCVFPKVPLTNLYKT